MSVWIVFPSARPHAEVETFLKLWRGQGYQVGLWRDPDTEEGFEECLIIRPYSGYAVAVNALVKTVLEVDQKCEWIVAAGDDIQPDLNHTAEEIAEQCSRHFADFVDRVPSTFGVMQPTGDRWGTTHNHRDPNMRGAYIDRVCGSPWMGREFCLRINQGRGPLWPEYFHMGEDEELQAVALKYGVLWQRPDLIQLHCHWGRALPGERMAPRERMPKFLERANSPDEWQKYKKLFAERQAAGFPGSEPL